MQWANPPRKVIIPLQGWRIGELGLAANLGARACRVKLDSSKGAQVRWIGRLAHAAAPA